MAKTPGIEWKDETAEVIDQPLFTPNQNIDVIEKYGLTVEEAVTCAEIWWNGTVSKLMKRAMVDRKANIDPLREDCVVKSGILLGEPFERLTKEEATRVVLRWFKDKWLPFHGNVSRDKPIITTN
ncbi:MAG: hypothetical protein AB7Q04_12985 [Steroidobacteraceae bacterium]